MSAVRISAKLRKKIIERACGRCEYCHIPQTGAFIVFEIDHIISLKHQGKSHSENLALSCPFCNRRKGSDIASIDPSTNDIVRLFNPRLDNWGKHFQLIGAEIIPLTPEGRATARLLQLNYPYRIEERKLLIESGDFE